VGVPQTKTRQPARWAWAALCLALVSLPFLAVEFIPNTDLPQHLGQLRLLGELWSGAPGLQLQWWTPYALVYALLAIPWLLLPPVLAGKVGVWLLAALQVVVVHWLAARHGRPVAAAVLASAFLFNTQFYYGFLNFQLGGIVFLAWLAVTARPPARPPVGWRVAVVHAGVAVLLYAAHALWFGFGMLWLAVDAALHRPPRRELLWRAAGVAPVVAAAGYWYLFLRSSAFATPADYLAGPLTRLVPDLFLRFALGGIRHPIDLIVVLAALLWIVAAGVAGWRSRHGGADRRLAAVALLLLAVYLAVPNKFSNTIRLSSRWLPYAMMVGLLAVGELPLRRVLRRTLAVVLLASLVTVNVAYWRGFEREELAGLPEALAVLPAAPRVMGLNYMETSPRISGRPYLQLYSWAYVIHGGSLNFSFGYFPPSLVVFEDVKQVAWTWGLEWFPKRVRHKDFQHFDFVLVGGTPATHARMAEVPEIEPMVDDGVWRLYRVRDPLPAPAAAAPRD
jgi:hypothetical protein